jgi:hypothetical protein
MLEVEKPRSIEEGYSPTLLFELELGNPFTAVRRVIIDVIFGSNRSDCAANRNNVTYTNKLYGRYGYMD